jgi:hypothetical protein
MWCKGTSGTFSMHQQVFHGAVHHVLFNLGNVVRHLQCCVTPSVLWQFMVMCVSTLAMLRVCDVISVVAEFVVVCFSTLAMLRDTFSIWTQFTVSTGKRSEHPRGMPLVARLLA